MTAKLTQQQACIISAYTGILATDFSTFHRFVEKVMKRPVFSHELGNPDTAKKLKDLTHNMFISICPINPK